jgi:NTP pyrophosphatase (non-canonical NTP hydrolase)
MTYQEAAIQFAIYKSRYYPFLGLAEEAGEVAGKIAKSLRKFGDEAAFVNLDLDDMQKELGDVLWMVAACCDELGLDMEEVMRNNINKLSSRALRNVIDGEGDNR